MMGRGEGTENSDWQNISTSGGLEKWGGGSLHFPEGVDDIICKVKDSPPLWADEVSLEETMGQPGLGMHTHAEAVR